MSDDADSTATPVASNIANTASNSSQANSSGKGVTFAPSPPRSALSSSNGTAATKTTGSFKNNSNLMDPTADPTLSRPDLLSLLSALRSELSSAKMDLSAEKAIRKRKEKNLVKLAKQLNSRSQAMDEAAGKLADLEGKYEETKGELEELTARHERFTRNHHQEMTEQQTSLRELSRRHDARMAELTSEHGKQIEELRRRLLEATLEGDRLRMELAQVQMREEPEKAGEVVDRTLRESRKTTAMMAASGSGYDRTWPPWGVGGAGRMIQRVRAAPLAAIGLVLIPLLAYCLAAMNSGDGICSPCPPGTTLSGSSSYANAAPWWAPSPWKRSAFSVLCSDRPIRTEIEWTGAKSGMGKLRVVDADLHAEVPGSKQSIILERKAMAATVDGREIQVTLNANGREEKIAAPWSRSKE